MTIVVVFKISFYSTFHDLNKSFTFLLNGYCEVSSKTLHRRPEVRRIPEPNKEAETERNRQEPYQEVPEGVYFI